VGFGVEKITHIATTWRFIMQPKTFPIYHKKHGEAIADDVTFPEFEALGWSKKKPKEKTDEPPKTETTTNPTE
jgi:hypothetical protein